MSIKGLAIGADVESSDADFIPGGGFTLDTGVYDMIVDTAYMGKSSKGAMSVNLHLKQAQGGKTTLRQTLWVTSGDAKGNKNWYEDSKGKKRLLPGMAQANHIALITTGSPLEKLTPEERTIKLYDFEKGAEVPTKVPALVEMLGKPIKIGVHKVRANKVVRVQGGGYADTAAERTFNEIDKVFYPDGLTITEKQAGNTEPAFIKKWMGQYPADYVNDQYKAVEGASSDDSLPDSDTADAATGSLFGSSDD